MGLNLIVQGVPSAERPFKPLGNRSDDQRNLDLRFAMGVEGLVLLDPIRESTEINRRRFGVQIDIILDLILRGGDIISDARRNFRRTPRPPPGKTVLRQALICYNAVCQFHKDRSRSGPPAPRSPESIGSI